MLGAIFHDAVIDAHRPRILVSASLLVQEICGKSGLSLVELLQPFGRQSLRGGQPLTVRSVQQQQPYTLVDFGVEFVDLRHLRQVLSLPVLPLDGPVQDIVNQSRLPKLQHHLQVTAARHPPPRDRMHGDGLRTPSQVEGFLHRVREQPAPWFLECWKPFFESLRYPVGEYLDHPVAILYAVSSQEEDPVEKLKQLRNLNQLPGLFRSKNAFDPNAMLPSVLFIHDASVQKPSVEESDALFKKLQLHCTREGITVFFVRLNSQAPNHRSTNSISGSPKRSTAFWDAACEKSRMLDELFQATSMSVGPPRSTTAPPPSSSSSSSSSPSPLPPVPSGGEGEEDPKHSQRSIHALENSDQPFLLKGSTLSRMDREALGTVVGDYIRATLLPFLQTRMQQLNSIVSANRRGLKNQIRFFFGGSKKDSSRRSSAASGRSPSGSPEFRRRGSPSPSSSSSSSASASAASSSSSSPSARHRSPDSAGEEEEEERLGGVVGGQQRGLSATVAMDAENRFEDTFPGFGKYSNDSIEARIRQLADLAFLLQDYSTAASNYRLVSGDYTSDENWSLLGSAQEALALSLAMQECQAANVIGFGGGNSAALFSGASGIGKARHVLQAFDTAFQSYDRIRDPLRSTRASVWLAEICFCVDAGNPLGGSSRLGRLSDAASCLLRAAEKDKSLIGALLMEQAGYAFLRSNGNGVPLVRKYAFHMTLAGYLFEKFGLNSHAIRCFESSRAMYEEKHFTQAQQHLSYCIAQDESQTRGFQNAAKEFARVLGKFAREGAQLSIGTALTELLQPISPELVDTSSLQPKVFTKRQQQQIGVFGELLRAVQRWTAGRGKETTAETAESSDDGNDTGEKEEMKGVESGIPLQEKLSSRIGLTVFNTGSLQLSVTQPPTIPAAFQSEVWSRILRRSTLSLKESECSLSFLDRDQQIHTFQELLQMSVHPTDSAQERILPSERKGFVGEAMFLRIQLFNPLLLTLPLSDIRLDGDFQDIQTSEDGERGEEGKAFIAEPKDLKLPPLKTVWLDLKIMPLRAGILRLRRILWRLADDIHCVHELEIQAPVPTLQDSPLQAEMDGRLLQQFLTIPIAPPRARLAVDWLGLRGVEQKESSSSSAFDTVPSLQAYEGECLRTELCLRAIDGGGGGGEGGISIHAFKVSHPGCVVLGRPSTPHAPEAVPSESRDATERGKECLNYDWETGLLHCEPPIFVPISTPPSTTATSREAQDSIPVRIPLWIRAQPKAKDPSTVLPISVAIRYSTEAFPPMAGTEKAPNPSSSSSSSSPSSSSSSSSSPSSASSWSLQEDERIALLRCDLQIQPLLDIGLSSKPALNVVGDTFLLLEMKDTRHPLPRHDHRDHHRPSMDGELEITEISLGSRIWEAGPILRRTALQTEATDLEIPLEMALADLDDGDGDGCDDDGEEKKMKAPGKILFQPSQDFRQIIAFPVREQASVIQAAEREFSTSTPAVTAAAAAAAGDTDTEPGGEMGRVMCECQETELRSAEDNPSPVAGKRRDGAGAGLGGNKRYLALGNPSPSELQQVQLGIRRPFLESLVHSSGGKGSPTAPPVGGTAGGRRESSPLLEQSSVQRLLELEKSLLQENERLQKVLNPAARVTGVGDQDRIDLRVAWRIHGKNGEEDSAGERSGVLQLPGEVFHPLKPNACPLKIAVHFPKEVFVEPSTAVSGGYVEVPVQICIRNTLPHRKVVFTFETLRVQEDFDPVKRRFTTRTLADDPTGIPELGSGRYFWLGRNRRHFPDGLSPRQTLQISLSVGIPIPPGGESLSKTLSNPQHDAASLVLSSVDLNRFRLLVDDPQRPKPRLYFFPLPRILTVRTGKEEQ